MFSAAGTNSTYIFGMSCRLPGAPNIAGYRALLQEGRCSVTEVPRDRWNHDLFFHPTPGMRGKTYTFAAGVLENLWGFDLSVFNLSPREAEQMDPQQRVLLQVAWEALEDARIDPAKIAGSRVGVYVGVSSMDHATIMARDASLADAYMMTGNTLSLVANRISHALDLRGPSIVVDTACSSSMVALDLARQALDADQIDTAIVAGVNILLDPASFAGFSAARMLSPEGRCKSFSDSADGYVRSEGAVAIVLCRADKAPAQAKARLIASDVNADGLTMNVALPSEEGQYALLSRLYDRAGIAADDLDFVEAHGTGTFVGDPIEAHAIGRALARHRSTPLPIGSAKSNVGHLEPVSGLVGLLKAVIAFEDRRLPATLHVEGLNPHIDFDSLNLTVARAAVPLVAEGPLMAGVSSFGFGGVNGHCIVQSVDPAPVPTMPAGSARVSLERERIFVTSAFCEPALRALASDYADRFDKGEALAPGGLVDQTWDGRGLHPKRVGIVANSAADAAAGLRAYAAGRKDARVIEAAGRGRDAPTVFVYSGNGSQYAGMCRLAHAQDAAYRDAFEQVDALFSDVAGWSVWEALDSETLDEDIKLVHVAQSVLFADQVAQSRALAARGIVPDACMGHSGGEVAAAWSGGALTLEDAVRLVVRRGETQRNLVGLGTMAALQVGAAEAHAYLESFADAHGAHEIEIAAINSPRNVTLTGPNEALAAFAKWAKSQHRLACVMLAINYAYHSAFLDPYEEELRAAFANLTFSTPRLPYFSCTHGSRIEGDLLNAEYWWENMRNQVQFQAAVEAAMESGYRTFLEIGAQPVLTSYLTDSSAGMRQSADIWYSLSKSDPEDANPLARAAARALAAGCRVQAGGVFVDPADTEAPQVDLPGYPWQNVDLRVIDSPEIKNIFGTDAFYHPLIGAPLAAGGHIWRRDLDEAALPALASHRVGDATWFPATAFAEMAFAAATRATGSAAVEVFDLDLISPMVLSSGTGVEAQTRIDVSARQISVESRGRFSNGPFREHMRARFSVLPALPTAQMGPAPTPIDPDENVGQWVYESAARVGLNYGPAFRGVAGVRRAGETLDVFLHYGTDLGVSAGSLTLDPVQLDCLLHGLTQAIQGTEFDFQCQALIPIRIGRLQIYAPGSTIASGRIEICKRGVQSILVDVTAFDAQGQAVLRVGGLRLRAVQLRKAINLADHAFHVAARPCLPALPPVEIEADALRQALAHVVPDDVAYDDALLLMSAATHQAIWSAFRAVADGAGVYEIRATGRPTEAALLSMLAAVDLAEPMPARRKWQISAECDIPNAQTLAQALLAERPDLSSDLIVLMRLADAVAEAIAACSGEATAAERLFGREAVQNLTDVPAQVADVMAAALGHIADAAPDGAAVRLGIMGEDRRAFDRLGPMSDAVERILLLSENEGARARPVDIRSVAWGDAVALDALAITAPGVMSSDTMDKRIETAVRPGGYVIVQCPARLPLRAAVDALESESYAPPVLLELVLRRLSALGLEVCVHYEMPEGVGGGDLIVCQRKAAPTLDGMGADGSGANIADWPDLWAQLHGRCTVAHGPLTVVTPDVVEAPTLLCIVDADGGTPLGERLLHLRDALMEAVEAGRAVTALVPQGARYHGGPPPDPAQHALWAALRTAMNEYPILSMRIFDSVDAVAGAGTLNQFRVLDRDAPEETEIVLTPTGALALRVVQGLPPQPSAETSDTTVGQQLAQPVTGRLDELAWHPVPRHMPCAGEVEIEVQATGLNYRDVMWALGLLPEEALEAGFAGPTLGLECAGRVSRVGEVVTDFEVGDAVLAFGPSCFSTHIVADNMWVTRLPEGVSPVKAATIPVAYFTAHYALVTLGQLRPEDTVLIHGGAGGVGLAAIAVAQRVGARVIATAGSPVKQKLLCEIGVAHVLSSRDTLFHAQVLELTGGAGVDVALNSLAGPAMEASLSLLRPYGRFLELGKQDYYANTAVGLRPLKNNISYFGIDVDSLLADRPNVARRVLQKVMAAVTAGDYPPLPHTQVSGDAVVEAFRLMQRSGHVGKIVVTPPEPLAHTPATGTLSKPGVSPMFVPDPQGWHVIAGGLGGIGIELAEAVRVYGGSRIALLSRRDTPPLDVQARIAKLRQSGADIRVIACDVTDRARVDAVLAELRAEAPIKGVNHAAMVLDDRTLADIDAANLERTLPVKVAGLAVLDAATRDDELQAFVAFTSLATMIGNYGQAAYVAANAYQEALIQCRAAEGLPALAMALGAISDAGYVSRDAALAGMLDTMAGKVQFPVAMAMNAMGRLLARPPSGPCVTLTPMSWAQPAATLRVLKHPSHEILRRLGAAAAASQTHGTLRADLAALPKAEAVKRAIGFLRAEISTILRVSESDLSPTRPLSEYGMDSLMGVELGLAAQQALGDDLPIPKLGEGLTIAGVAEAFVAHTQSGSAEDPAAPRAQDERRATLRAIGRQHVGAPSNVKAAE